EGLERTSRRRRRAALDGKRLGSPRWASRRRPGLERPVHDESESCSGTRYAFDRLCECVQMVLPNPLEAEGARDLNGELPGLEAGRPQRGDPGVEIFREQASTELPSHLPPDGVEHPPTPRCADPGSVSSRCPARLCPHVGRSRRTPRETSRSQLRPPPTPVRHTAAPLAGATASNPSPASCSRKQYVAGGSAFTAVHRILQGGKPLRVVSRRRNIARIFGKKFFRRAKTFFCRAPVISASRRQRVRAARSERARQPRK